MRYIVAAALILVAGSLQAGQSKYEYQLYRLDKNTLGFSCNHGGVPRVDEALDESQRKSFRDGITTLICEK